MILAAGISIFAVSAVLAGEPGHDMGNMPMTKQSGSAVDNKTLLSTYPLDYDIVSGEKLGTNGDPIIKLYKGREVRFASDSSRTTFEKDQNKYLKKLDQAIIAQEKPNYPLETCVVTGEKLEHTTMGDPVDLVYNNHLVRFCCNMCPATFKKNPDKFLKKISDAYAAADASKEAAPASVPAK
jgi:YHS domain-containing protein